MGGVARPEAPAEAKEVGEGISEKVGEGVAVPVNVAVPEGVGVRGAVALEDREVEPEVLGLAPVEREAAALELTVLLPLLVAEGVAALLLLPL